MVLGQIVHAYVHSEHLPESWTTEDGGEGEGGGGGTAAAVKVEGAEKEKEGQEVLLVTKHAVVSGAQEASRGVFTGLVEGKIEVVVDPRNHIVVPFELRLSGSARGSSNLTASKAAMLSTFAADLSNA